MPKAPKSKRSFRFPFDLVRPEIEIVERQIAEQAEGFDPSVGPYIATICESSGKRIRPALTVLGAGATGEVNDDHLRLGLILELVHIASLVHDDIMDRADRRRGLPTANARWGNSLSVLLGDSLFAHALMLSTEFEDRSISREIAVATREVCTGEIIQTQRQFDLQLSVSDYYRIIEMKTAALFGAATGLAARINGADPRSEEALRNYGRKLGTAYQIYDDCLDLVGESEAAGKTLRTDLAKGKLTLPILKLIESATEKQRATLGRLLIQREPLDVPTLAGIADYAGAIESAIESGKEIAESARQDLVGLPDTEYAEALESITRYLDSLLDGCRL